MTSSSENSIHVIGATGRTGRVLCGMLAARGTEVFAVARDPVRAAALGLSLPPRIADLTDPPALRTALADATTIIGVSYAAWTRAVLNAAPASARLVLVGTARRYSHIPDPAADAARAAERILRASRRDAVMLHPTMIYGAADDGTATRLATMLARTRILPLPGGGAALVQPIHVADLATCLMRAADQTWTQPQAIAVGGPVAVPYADFVREVARASGVHAPLIVRIPDWFATLAARLRPGIARLMEDRSVDLHAMRATLGVEPRSLTQGLEELFASGR